MIPRGRFKLFPKHLRNAHAYCYFLHDECARMLVEYETAGAHTVSFKFANKKDANKFETLTESENAVTAMRQLGLHEEARRVVLNTITLAMVSDCAHHIYEALMCLEKRKVVPAFNLLRKPLLDSLLYLSWMVAEEDNFYTAFTSGDPVKITRKMISNRRKEVLQGAIDESELTVMLSAEDIEKILFDASNASGLYKFFQHAVHLVTVERLELKTSPENFNFIFSDPFNDDVYELLYAQLPTALLYLSHVIRVLFDRMKSMDSVSRDAFTFRSIGAYLALEDHAVPIVAEQVLNRLPKPISCPSCNAPLKLTQNNLQRLLLNDRFRCATCRKVASYAFSWLF